MALVHRCPLVPRRSTATTTPFTPCTSTTPTSESPPPKPAFARVVRGARPQHSSASGSRRLKRGCMARDEYEKRSREHVVASTSSDGRDRRKGVDDFAGRQAMVSSSSSSLCSSLSLPCLPLHPMHRSSLHAVVFMSYTPRPWISIGYVGCKHPTNGSARECGYRRMSGAQLLDVAEYLRRVLRQRLIFARCPVEQGRHLYLRSHVRGALLRVDLKWSTCVASFAASCCQRSRYPRHAFFQLVLPTLP